MFDLHPKLARKLRTMQKVYVSLLLVLLTLQLAAQNNKQNIRGTVLDKQSLSPVIGATVQILNTNKGTKTDEKGMYLLSDIEPGRYELKVSYIGYKEVSLSNIIVSSGKECIQDFLIEENVRNLKETVIKVTNKTRTNNELATISARTFSTEEVNRYAGGRSDPARLVANFAGVSAPDDSRNDIVVRGNSPVGVLWRIEGMNVPNPNHFATIGTTGGPVSALNTNILRNSDFFTSAFPAEYGNANAGVFDLGFRKGNANKREHMIQFGMLTGIEAATEGPLKKGSDASYLIAYRYSFTGLAQAIGLNVGTTATPFYQDLTFKVNSGEGKYGRFTLFGLAGKSKISFKHDDIDSSDLFADPTADSYFTSDVAVVGLKHLYKVNSKSYINTILGATYAASNYDQDSVYANSDPVRVVVNQTKRLNYNFMTNYNYKVNRRLFLKAGVQAEVMNLDLFYKVKINAPNWKYLWDYDNATSLLQAFVHAKYSFSDNLTANVGLHTQYLTLNGSSSLEPRAALKYSMGRYGSLSMGYGLHSQMQPTDVYFFRKLQADGSYDESNRDLAFTKSHHIVLGYDLIPLKDWRVKLETYYQHLFNVPVHAFASSYSMLNTGSSFYPNNQSNLRNTGTGTNYGVELTVEKFYSKGYYGLMTATLYDSKYKGSDGVEHNTAFNSKYVFNMLAGKEFKLGAAKRNTFFTDIKLTTAGGRYFTPVDLAASQLAHEQVLMGDTYAFSERNPNYFRIDFKTGFTYNSKKHKRSHSFFFDIQNVTNHKNVFAVRYNAITNSMNTAYQIGLFPNFQYKFQF